VNPSAARLASLFAGAAFVALAQREQVIAAAPSHRRQPFEAGVARVELDVHPPPLLEPRLLVAFVDHRPVGPIGVFLRFDQQVEPAGLGAESDVLVAVAFPSRAEPGVRRRAFGEAAVDARDAADVVENDVVVRTPGDDAAGFEHAALGRRIEQIRQLAFGDESQGGKAFHVVISSFGYLITRQLLNNKMTKSRDNQMI
jgi:hypothetical protein